MLVAVRLTSYLPESQLKDDMLQTCAACKEEEVSSKDYNQLLSERVQSVVVEKS